MSIETLTRREADILGALKLYFDKRDASVHEQHFHHALYGAQEMRLNAGEWREPAFSFHHVNWHEVNESFRDVKGLFFYSQDIHSIVESLVEKGIVKRDENDLLLLSLVNKVYTIEDVLIKNVV